MGLDVDLYKLPNDIDTLEQYRDLMEQCGDIIEQSYSLASFHMYGHDKFKGIDWNNFDRSIFDEIRPGQLSIIREEFKKHQIPQSIVNSSHSFDELQTDGDSSICINYPSVLHPEGLFQVGYFRSSYNPNGINNVLRSLDLPTLYDIFDVDDNEYYRAVDWKSAHDIALQIKTSLEGLDVDESYKHSIDIVIETIDYVLMSDDPSRYFLSWSA